MKKRSQKIEQIKKEMSTRRKPQQERAKATAELILQSARTILTRDGADGLSLRSLTAECGMTKGAVYGHFSGTSAILYYLYKERLEQETDDIRNLLSIIKSKGGKEAWADLLIQDNPLERWNSPFDIALVAAARRDHKISQLMKDQDLTIRNMIANVLQESGYTQSKYQLLVIARFLVGIIDTSYNLAVFDKLKAQTYIHETSNLIIKNLLTFLQSDCTPAKAN